MSVSVGYMWYRHATSQQRDSNK